MDDDESPHDNGMLMLHAFLTYAENGVPPADYILEHFAICFRKILKEGTYTYDEDVDEHPQFAHKLDTKGMGKLVREALYIAQPYTSDKHWDDAQWFYSLEKEVTERRRKDVPSKVIFADITTRQFESEGRDTKKITGKDRAKIQERFRRFEKKLTEWDKQQNEIIRQTMFKESDSRNIGHKHVSDHELKDSKS